MRSAESARAEAGAPFAGTGNPFTHWHFVVAAVRGEFKRQFARSTLGAAWLILHPLARTAIFALVFSEILLVRMQRVDGPSGYAVYLLAGMCAWSLFGDVVTRSTSIFLDYAAVLRKVPVPHLCMPLIAAGGALFNHVLLLAVTAIVLVLLGQAPGLAWLALLPAMLVLLALALSLGLVLGILNVFRRDIGHLTGIALQFWFWLTPIVYAADTLPAGFAWIAELNPLLPLVRIYQDALLFDRFSFEPDLWKPVLLLLVASVVAAALFRRASVDIADSL